MTLPVVRSTTWMPLDAFAELCGLHPDLLRRLVVLGLIEPAGGSGEDWWFTAAEARRVARIQRLRADLALNYSALGLVLDLLDRIEELEQAHRRATTATLEN
jgi:DNA-binding transcriptional MerR regulator